MNQIWEAQWGKANKNDIFAEKLPTLEYIIDLNLYFLVFRIYLVFGVFARRALCTDQFILLCVMCDNFNLTTIDVIMSKVKFILQ